MDFVLTPDLIPAVLSVVGAFLVARYDRWSGWGWLLWIVSNLMWLVWATLGTADGNIVRGIILQNGIFLLTSLKGLIKWRHMFPKTVSK